MSVELPLLPPNQNLDNSSLFAHMTKLQDCYLVPILPESGKYEINKRFGLKLFMDLGTGQKVDGLHWSEKQQSLFMASGGEQYKTTDRFGANKTDITGVGLTAGEDVEYAETVRAGDWVLLIADGGQLKHVGAVGDVANVVNTGSAIIPNQVPSVAVLDGFVIIFGKESNEFFFSYPFQYDRFDVGDAYTAEMAVDDILNIKVIDRRLNIFGKSSIETWYNAGQAGDPFVRRLSGVFHGNGLYAEKILSVLTFQGRDAAYFLDKNRKLVKLEGNSAVEVGTSYDRFIQSLDRISDGYSSVITAGNKVLFSMTFPQEKLTLIYDPEVGCFYEWGSYNENTAQYNIFTGGKSVYCREWNKHLIGSNTDGKIYEISPDYSTDNGNTIRAYMETGHINFGDMSRIKGSSGLKIALKRGVGKEGNVHATPFLRHRKMDNGRFWGNFRSISLGKQGDTALIRQVYRQGGAFFTRKHQIVMPDAAPVAISGMWEEVY